MIVYMLIYSIVVSGIFGTIIGFLLHQRKKLKNELTQLKANPTELDLSLATHKQIVKEIAKRPHKFALIIMKEPDPNKEVLNVTVDTSFEPDLFATLMTNLIPQLQYRLKDDEE